MVDMWGSTVCVYVWLEKKFIEDFSPTKPSTNWINIYGIHPSVCIAIVLDFTGHQEVVTIDTEQ